MFLIIISKATFEGNTSQLSCSTVPLYSSMKVSSRVSEFLKYSSINLCTFLFYQLLKESTEIIKRFLRAVKGRNATRVTIPTKASLSLKFSRLSVGGNRLWRLKALCLPANITPQKQIKIGSLKCCRASSYGNPSNEANRERALDCTPCHPFHPLIWAADALLFEDALLHLFLSPALRTINLLRIYLKRFAISKASKQSFSVFALF